MCVAEIKPWHRQFCILTLSCVPSSKKKHTHTRSNWIAQEDQNLLHHCDYTYTYTLHFVIYRWRPLYLPPHILQKFNILLIVQSHSIDFMSFTHLSLYKLNTWTNYHHHHFMFVRILTSASRGASRYVTHLLPGILNFDTKDPHLILYE